MEVMRTADAVPVCTWTKRDTQYAYNVTARREFAYNPFCGGKKISIHIAYSECVFVALVIQLSKRMRRVTLSSVACPAPHYHIKGRKERN